MSSKVVFDVRRSLRGKWDSREMSISKLQERLSGKVFSGSGFDFSAVHRILCGLPLDTIVFRQDDAGKLFPTPVGLEQVRAIFSFLHTGEKVCFCGEVFRFSDLSPVIRKAFMDYSLRFLVIEESSGVEDLLTALMSSAGKFEGGVSE